MNGQTLAAIIHGMGGSIVDDRTFSFPVSKVREVVPKLEQIGIGCIKVQELASSNRQFGSRGAENIVHLRACSKEPEPVARIGGHTRTV